MYWYYFQSARGVRVWWKQWITRLQITQFVIDLGLYSPGYITLSLFLTFAPGFVYFASYTYFTSTYWPNIPNAGKCAGEEFAAFSGCGILSSYLVLFISFYLSTYKRSGKRAAPKAVQTTDASVNAVPNGNGNKKNSSVKSRKA